jgi:transcriptional regulator with GAF, ATPase, and Fis domain
MQGYLVIRDGVRWTDVFRLASGVKVSIGRASSCQIVIRDERASRNHAEVLDESGHWLVRDLASRNGTRVNQQPIEGDHRLEPGETITVAGCNMTFVEQLADAFQRDVSAGDEGAPGREEDQATKELGGGEPEVLHRQSQVPLLERTPRSHLTESQTAVAPLLVRLAFTLARCDSTAAAAQATLDAVLQELGVSSGAVLMLPPHATTGSEKMMVLATRQADGRSYHRLAEVLALRVMRDGEALLARNLSGDHVLVSQDSRGNWSTSSTIVAPIRCEGKVRGMLHLYSQDAEKQLASEQLDLALAASENLGLALVNLQRQAELSQSLKRTKRHVDLLREQLDDRHRIVGDSEPIRLVMQSIQRAGPTGATVLIRGESGVGKELVAAALHARSNRREGPMICLNCAALSPTLLESELFGHEKGAFTGATDRKIGKFEAADGGTLMLDEIGEMSPEVQSKFLRVLEGHPFERLGGNTPIRVDVRVVAATNRDLETAIREQKFRADLYYRLQVLELHIPPLRDRGDDVIVIADHFIDRYAREMGRRIDGLTSEAKAKLLKHTWPGNVRELKNAIERAVVLCPDATIDAEDLVLSNLSLVPTSASKENVVQGSNPSSTGRAATAIDDAPFAATTLDELERIHIFKTLESTGGNKSRASQLLGIERSTLDRKLKRYEG